MPTVTCRRCNQEKESLPRPPFRGNLGQKIHETVCKSCWTEWQGEQTKIINENRLSLGNPSSQQVLDRAMKAFLKLDE